MDEYSTSIASLKKPSNSKSVPTSVPSSVPTSVPLSVPTSIPMPTVSTSSPPISVMGQMPPPPMVQSNNPQPVQNLPMMPLQSQDNNTLPAPPQPSAKTSILQNILNGSAGPFSDSNNGILPLLATIIYFLGARGYGLNFFTNIFKLEQSYSIYINSIVVFCILLAVQIKNSL